MLALFKKKQNTETVDKGKVIKSNYRVQKISQTPKTSTLGMATPYGSGKYKPQYLCNNSKCICYYVFTIHTVSVFDS